MTGILRVIMALAILLTGMISACVAIAQQTQSDQPLWLRYPAVSPDASQVAFAYQGQIWIVPALGGEAVSLTSAPFYSAHPVWSPDGNRIAFSSNRHGNADVFVMPVAGGPITRLTYHSATDTPMAFSDDGSKVFFRSNRLGSPVADAIDSHKGLGVPLVQQLYSVPSGGGRERLELATQAFDLVPGKGNGQFLYTSVTSVEDAWRKHHVSDATRDIWQYTPASGNHQRLTEWRGEDRNAIYAPDQNGFYWLSERSGSFNIWYRQFEGGEARQITAHEKWPVRFLSSANDGSLVYSWNGQIWRLPANATEPEPVDIHIRQGNLIDGLSTAAVNANTTELAISPDGEELALIARGEVFVVSTLTGNTRRLTSTSAAERFVQYAPDGRSIIYASDRSGDWDIYEIRLIRDTDNNFTGAVPVEEKVVIDSDTDSYQPIYSPSGKQIAYVDERSSIRVFDKHAGSSVEILPIDGAYSYNDGDMEFSWSPDGNWLVARTSAFDGSEVEILDASGKLPRRNLSLNGYTDNAPVVSADGNIVTWTSDRKGLRAATTEGVQKDIYAAFLTYQAYEDYKTLGEHAAEKPQPEGQTSTRQNMFSALPDISGLDKRTERLTPFSSSVAFHTLTPDNKILVFVSLQENNTAAGYMVDLTSHATRQLFTRPANGSELYVADAGVKNIYVLSGGTITRINLVDGKSTAILFRAEVVRDVRGEVAYIFDHSWRATSRTFYRPDMQGVDWQEVGDHYRKFVPHIVHWEDLAELLSEMQGELNASHQGTHFHTNLATGDETASLGLYYDPQFVDEGVRVSEVLDGGPADQPESALLPGAVIVSVGGQSITPETGIHRLLNRRAGQSVLLEVRPKDSKDTVYQTVKPVSILTENELAYQRWLGKRREIVESLSSGRVGYIHIRGMGLGPYQYAYGELFGRYRDAEAVIVDIRSNGGGNLHDQLVVMLTGSSDSSLVSRNGNEIFRNPVGRFTRPTTLLVNASSYSDASVFPTLYKQKGMGVVIGERVPGTGTAVSAVAEIQPGLGYRVPELGFQLHNGQWFENNEVIPDVLIYNDPESIAAGRDLQLEKAVSHLLETLASE